MFKFAVAALAFIGSAVAQPTNTMCSTAQPLLDAVTFLPVLDLGASFLESIPVIGLTLSGPGVTGGLWFSLEVVGACTLDIGISSCEGVGFGVEMMIYESCGGPSFASATENCDDGLGAELEFSNPSPLGPTTTYYIHLFPTSGVVPASNAILLQGNVAGLANGECKGDPHFTRWQHEARDSFHGECDMVMFHKENIEGEDLDVHIRNTIKDSYSYVEAVAMKYGKDSIEFQHDALYINGDKIEDDSYIPFGENSFIQMVDEAKRKFIVNVKHQAVVEVRSTKHFMAVKVHGSELAMDGSTGILGDYQTGNMVGRNGSEMDNFMDFGFEWQVSPADPQIFMNAREPQLPYEACRMPSVSAEARRRKLRGQDRKLYEQAVKACDANQIPENMQSCIDDVMFTGELELAYI